MLMYTDVVLNQQNKFIADNATYGMSALYCIAKTDAPTASIGGGVTVQLVTYDDEGTSALFMYGEEKAINIAIDVLNRENS